MDTILVVDDNTANRLLLKKTLESGTYQVIEAETGEEAVALFESEHPDLVLMDIMLPGMNGKRSAHRIKQLAGSEHVPIIYVSALKDDDVMIRALGAGGDAYITKPINIHLLTSKINAHLRTRRLYLELAEKNRQLEQHNHNLARQNELVEYFFDTALSQSYLDRQYIRHHISSLSAFSGDVLLAERGPYGGLHVLLGDFTGHGLTAAMGTLPIAQTFFQLVRQGAGTSRIARELNKHVFALTPAQIFLAANIISIDPAGEFLSYWIGGMPSCYLVNDDNTISSRLDAQHMPLGIIDDPWFDDRCNIIPVNNTQSLFMYTDGVTEAVDVDGQFFGTSRLEQALNTPGELIGNIVAAVKDFTGKQDQTDDITLVEMKCTQIPPPPETDADQATTPPLVPVELSFELGPEDFRTQAVSGRLATQICAQDETRLNRDVIETILSELYANALEHGILEMQSQSKDSEGFEQYYQQRSHLLDTLESGTITITASIPSGPDSGIIRLTCSHSGKGFDPSALLPVCDSPYGNGLEIVRQLCESLDYEDGGRTAIAVYRFNQN